MLKPVRSIYLKGPTSIGQRIVVIGSTCAGKTTLAKTLADVYRLPCIELDALHWRANWQSAPTYEFREIVYDIVTRERWVVDGNYSKIRDIVWPLADTFIWLDYSLSVVLWRWLKRTTQRVITRERLWNGNRETLRNAFLSSDSLLFWILRRFYGRRREYWRLLNSSEYNHITRVHLCSPRQTDRFITSVYNSVKSPYCV